MCPNRSLPSRRGRGWFCRKPAGWLIVIHSLSTIIQSFNHSIIQSFNHSIIQSFNH
ncbi:MAG: Sulfur carrier protein adenylyltransferase ThiF [uncultured Cytophagales bacterium]|uniref:Sulfur carrier protein adenylyltransferase ThiF n=1 Tax=uncultured Cytophagales bacterium TaxID=158755 RepID=A0A6J4K641_9SPHI|nr:MAG: Sulfur carrier protein adenylyltransferase ThiF [uncultured Cytophagales bacterium]